MNERCSSRFGVGDLVTVSGEPPASGEVLALAPSVGRVRVKFGNGAFWLHETHLELLASGDQRVRVGRGEGEVG